MRASVFLFLSILYVVLIYGLPLCAVAWLIAIMHGTGGRAAAFVCAPVTIATLVALIAGALSTPHQRWIKPGRMRRNLGNPSYFHRRLYGLCWTALYYATPLYGICLAIPVLKRITFRMFGYRGQMKFTVYPDTWIRDLPLLNIGERAYVSNKATLGTNMVMGKNIVVDRIELERDTLIGHLAMIGPGTYIGSNSEVGVGASIGLRVRIGADSIVGGLCAVESGTEIGEGVRIGARSLIGAGAMIANGASIPLGGFVAAGSESKDRRSA